MTRVSGLVSDDDGTPLAGVYVVAELVGSPWLTGHAGQVEGREDTHTGPDGRWTLDLLPRSAFESNTYWRVRVWERATFGLNVPDPPPGGGGVDITTPGVLRPDQPDPPGPPDQFELDDLADVEVGDAPADVGLLWRKGPDGVWRTEPAAASWSTPLRLAATAPDPEHAPAGALWVRLDDDLRIYERR